MIERSRGKILFICDGDGGTCGEEFQTDSSEFNAALEELKMEPEETQWASIKQQGEWKHFCSECKVNEEFED